MIYLAMLLILVGCAGKERKPDYEPTFDLVCLDGDAYYYYKDLNYKQLIKKLTVDGKHAKCKRN